VLVPGLVNPHAHLELTAYHGRIKPALFWDWLTELIKLRAEPRQVEREQFGVREGAWQSLRAGVTCVGDISRLNLHWRMLKPIPIRKVCFVELLSLAKDPPRTIDELKASVAEVEEDALLTVGVTPHTPYTVTRKDLRAAMRLATELNRPWCAHWAETREERAFLMGDSSGLPPWMLEPMQQHGIESPGMSAIDYLEECCAECRPGTLAHVNYIERGEAKRLADAKHVIVYCRRAHAFFGHAPHPFRELMHAGVTVAIGTDSSACNDNLAVLEELRFLRDQLNAPPTADTLLRMVTVNAAQALGLADQIGTIEPGKQADLATFPCDPDVADPIAALVDRAPPAAGVWVAGDRVWWK
jgi:cytosine/adenosine deaminase-related metal-dependent hydrolase